MEDSRLYKIKNSEELKRKSREKYANNKEFFKNKKRNYRQSKKYKDSQKTPEGRLLKSMSKYIRCALKEVGLKKNNKSTMKYVNCSWNFFYEYIELQFVDGMNWNNYGNRIGHWSLDHYIPREAFDLTKIEEQEVCFGWKNCRPLWHTENETKQDTMPDGSKARLSKDKYSLQDKINLIENNFLLIKFKIDKILELVKPSIFINKSKWKNFSLEQMEKFENDVFNYYKTKGFPYFNLSHLEKQEIFNKLINFNSYDILQKNNILSQNMLGLNLASCYMPHIWETKSGNFLTPMDIFKDDYKFRLAIKKE